jgi:hypothetical protein
LETVFKTLFSNTLTLVTQNEHFEHHLIPLFLQKFGLESVQNPTTVNPLKGEKRE